MIKINIIKALNQSIACITVLSQKLRTFHWLLVDQNFFNLHQLFGNLYNQLIVDIDDFAERIKQLKGIPIHTLQRILVISLIRESIKKQITSQEMVSSLMEDFGILKECLNVVVVNALPINDRTTIFLVDTKVGLYDKNLWFLKSFLQNS